MCVDISDWVDADGDTCETYASGGYCGDYNIYEFAVNGISAHEACGASCPNLCGGAHKTTLFLSLALPIAILKMLACKFGPSLTVLANVSQF